MTVRKDAILWPIRFDASSYGVRVTIDLTPETLTLNVSTERNYFVSGDGQADAATDGGLGDLVQMLEDLLDSHSAASGAGSFTVSVTDDGQLSIQNNMAGSAQNWSIDWTNAASTLDHTIFGFLEANYSHTAGLIEAPKKTKGVWYPDRTRAIDSRDRQPTVGAVAETISGLSRASRLVAPKKTREIGWRLVPQAKALDEYADSTEPYGSFESAWVNALSYGYSFRVYDDASKRSAVGYELYRMRSLSDPMQRSAEPVRFEIDLSLVRADD
jgi:hypothetical protein